VENENRFSVGIVEKIAKYLGVEVRAEVVEVKN
jgi:hypothetical protein